jgi:hypothetical protein
MPLTKEDLAEAKRMLQMMLERIRMRITKQMVARSMYSQGGVCERAVPPRQGSESLLLPGWFTSLPGPRVMRQDIRGCLT